VILVVGSAAFLLSMREIIRTNKGRELVKLLEVERMKLETLVDREIAIVLNMASSPLIWSYFQNPSDERLRGLAMEEIGAFRRALTGSIFWISDTDKMFYFEEIEPYRLNPDLPENYWYKMTMSGADQYNFNINYNPDLKVTNLWINAPVRNMNHRTAGMLGAGIDLTAFVNAVYKDYRGKAHFYFFNAAGEITGATDIGLVAAKKSIDEELGALGAEILVTAKNLDSGQVHTAPVKNGQMAVICVPKLGWYAVAIWPDSLDDFKTALTVFFLVVILVIAFIIVLSNIFIARLLTPLRETMESLEAASKAKSDFLAKMSHEIRTPLNAIIGIVQIRMQDSDMPRVMEESLDKIYGSSCHLLGIINDILDMSKIETGKLVLAPLEYDVPSLINDAVQFNIVRIGSKTIDFKLYVDETLPAKLYGDELRLKQVLNNLLSNSFKYTETGYVSLSVSHTAAGDDVTLVLKIEDTGQGIKEEDLKLLFSEYQRFNTGANRHTEGTGLGLNITRRLVDMMGGGIDVHSVYGKGSTFTVTVQQKAVPGVGVLGPELAKNLSNFTFTSMKRSDNLKIARERMPYGSVLVVDDVEVNLIVARGLMALYGIAVETVMSGHAAIDLINAGNTYDIVFMDHMMPVIDGIETTKKLRDMGYKGVIVALTANAILGNDEMFVKNGFDDFISKPIDVKRLNEVLVKYVRDKHIDAGGKKNHSQSGNDTSTVGYPKPEPDHSQSVNHTNTVENHPKTPISRPQPQAIKLSPKFYEALKRDVAKAITVMRDTLSGDMGEGSVKAFTTSVHGMKSAFAAIGEAGISKLALDLEMAGRGGDTGFITANTEAFIKTLEEFTSHER
jgi:signal transduction histidine kinase/DNA-binding response OmpR family regulator